jgi:conjugative transfer pilus assembly protein TraH
MFTKTKVNLAVVSVIISIGMGHAQANGDVVNMFQSIGANANVTNPGVYRGQTMNHMVGGGASIRIPQRNYQLASMSPPSLSYGCGGIDAYLGAFSFINADQLVEMMQNIGNNATGAIFKLALDSISPQLGGVIDYFADMANKINSMNINACEAATGIVTAGRDAIMNKSISNIGGQLSSAAGNLFDYFAEAKTEIASNISVREQAREKMRDNPETKPKMENINITWTALDNLKLNGGARIPDDEAKLFMAIFGTTVCNNGKAESAPSSDSTPDRKCVFIPPSGNVLNFVSGSGDNADLELKMPGRDCSYMSGTDSLRKCADPDVVKAEAVFEFSINGVKYNSIEDYVGRQMEVIKDAVTNRTVNYSFSQGQIYNENIRRAYGLLELSRVPAWTLIKLSSTDAIGNAYYDSAKKAISADIAYSYVLSRANQVRRALSSELADGRRLNDQYDISAVQENINQIDKTLALFSNQREEANRALAELGAVSATIGNLNSAFNQRMASLR